MNPPQFVYFILQEKGGTRKTFLAAVLAALFENNGRKASLVDADLSAGHLLELYADALSIGFDADGLRAFREALRTGLPAIIDFGANTSQHAGLFIREAANTPGIQTVILCPYENDPKSKLYLLDYIQQYPASQVFAVAVCREGEPRPPAPASIPEARILSLAQLSARLVAFYANAKSSPAALAAGIRPGDGAQRRHRPESVAMRSYLRLVSAELSKVPGLPRFN